ncbi:hypothetical protein ASG76_00645 [Nocardioides sp. Soil774]|uniref:hypothetical protein n=1 Tax=Nocardioides sp. Soil774 TaxID=1736408 RepID=UPI0006FE101C|nr:hypothetical protein [Nocardioides sp. Soil774]KRE97272.1 hypothetical protein ASG76_00645 [Nocardioides sp. Soil774]
MHDNDWTTAPTVPVGAANFTTALTYWPNVETRKGRYDWTRLDQQVAGAETLGAQPMVLLGQTPRFHSARPRSADFTDFMPKIKAWKRWVTEVAKRYGTKIDYQIWPEPNIIQNWQGSPRQMATLTVVASKAIQKHAGKKARVVSPAVALRLASQRRWTVDYFKQSIGGVRVHRYVDAIAVDPFPEQAGTPEDSHAIVRGIRRELARIGVRKPIWSNEINYGVPGGGAVTTTEYSVAKQRSYVIRTYVLSAAARVQRTYWLGWFSNDTLAINMADSTGRALGPGKSYAVVHSWLNKTNFKRCATKKGMWVCTAKKGDEVRTIYWKRSGSATTTTPRSTIRVENQKGVVVSDGGRTTVRVTTRPVMVASRR